MSPEILLAVVSCIALVIIIGTVAATIYVLRRTSTTPARKSTAAVEKPVAAEASADASDSMTETMPTTTAEDVDSLIAQAELSPFELGDLSNSFKGISQGSERSGIVIHAADPDISLIAFTSQIFSQQNGVVKAETTYGSMELIIAQGRAGVKWEGQPLGVLDYTNQRILGPQGQLLGSMERPPIGQESGSYPVGFFGQKAADITTQINAMSTLRWFGDEEEAIRPALENVADELEDTQTLLVLAIFLLEIGFMSLLTTVNG
jgi:hypothetical protein